MDRLSDSNLDVVKDDGVQYLNPFINIYEDIPGGGTLKNSEAPSNVTVIGAGTMVAKITATAGVYNIVKTAKSTSTQSSSTSHTYVVSDKYKGLFKVGEYIGIYGQATLSTITSITHTAATTDTIVTGTSIGALATASIIIEGAAAATVVAVDQTSRYTAIGFIRDVTRVREDDLTTLNNVNIGIVVRGSVNESLLPYVLEAGNKTALTDRIMFQ